MEAVRGGLLILALSGCELIVGSKDVAPLTLDRLIITPGTIDQALDDDTLHYTATVPITGSVQITAHSADPAVQIEIGQNPAIDNGVQSEPIAVSGGATSLSIKLEAKDIGVTTSYTLLLNVAGAQLAEPASHPLNQGGAMPISVAAADFNGDGTPDVVVGFADTGFRIYSGKTFAPIGPLVPLPASASYAVPMLNRCDATLSMAYAALNSSIALSYCLVSRNALPCL
jgi:hypothetical protein